MVVGTPRRNLPPDAEPWGRHVDAAIEEIKKSLGITTNNLRASQRQVTGAVRNLAVVTQEVEATTEAAIVAVEVAETKSAVTQGPKPPATPAHGDV